MGSKRSYLLFYHLVGDSFLDGVTLLPDTNVRSVSSFNYKLLITHFQDLFYLFKRRGIR